MSPPFLYFSSKGGATRLGFHVKIIIAFFWAVVKKSIEKIQNNISNFSLLSFMPFTHHKDFNNSWQLTFSCLKCIIILNNQDILLPYLAAIVTGRLIKRLFVLGY